MTREELAGHDGREGRRAYVAVNGKIYDFTGSRFWPAGDHARQHRAGCDLSAELAQAPHVRAVIERFPVVGDLVEALPATKKKPWGIVLGASLLVLALLGYLLR